MKDKAIAILLCASAFLSGLAQAQPTSTTAPGQKPVSRVSPLADGVELTAGTLVLRITALSPSVVRLRYAPTGIFGADSSFAVVKETGFVVPKVDVADFSDNVVLKTGELVVTIQKPSLRVVFADNAGRAILSDREHLPFQFTPDGFLMWKEMPADEHYYGLGDRGVSEDRRDHAFTMWNTDAYGWEESTDPLYKSIPFFIGMRSGHAYGLLFDNTYRTSFDMGKAYRDLYFFGADGGELNYYVINGPEPKKVLERYADLTGHMPLPPLFTMGYQQCRYSYYPESRVREVAREFRKLNIPADVIYLDIDYQDHYRPFTINRQYFPHFEQMVRDLGQEGWKVVVISDLHIAAVPGYKPYDEGVKNNYFLKNPDGTNYIGPVWPGPSAFPDFTREEVRKWYGSQYADFVKMGIRGFWNDMNEPSVFDRADKTVPLDVINNTRERRTQRELHNVMGLENVHATYEGLLTLAPDLRPFVLTRAAYAGAQRYAATWTGDNQATWNHMRLTLPTVTGLGNSGYAFTGVDVGGYEGDPTPELLTRWTELGTFIPIDRNHAEKGGRDREPWVDGPEHLAIRKWYIEQRYRLLPYIYTSIEATSRTGVPLMRSLFLDFPDDSRMVSPDADSEFMFGDDLLVAPVVREWPTGYDAILPKGIWYDYWTGQRIDASGDTIQLTPGNAIALNNDKKKLHLKPGLDQQPVFVRAGAIVPRQPVVIDTDEIPQGPLELLVYPGPNCSGVIYADDGKSFAYRKGEYYRSHFTCEADMNSLRVTIGTAEGKYTPWWKSYEIVAIGASRRPSSVTVNGRRVTSFQYSASQNSVSVQVPVSRAGSEMVIGY